MPEFKIVSDFNPTGDQPDAIDRLVRGAENGLHHQSLMGVTGSGKTFTMACIVERLQQPTLVLAHNKTLAAQLATEFKEFFPKNSVEYFVSLLRLLPAGGVRTPHRHLHREGRRHQRAARQAAPRRNTCAPDTARRAHRRIGVVHLRARLSRGISELRRLRPQRRNSKPPKAHASARRHAIRAQRLRPLKGPFPRPGRYD